MPTKSRRFRHCNGNLTLDSSHDIAWDTMADILIRNVPPCTIAELKRRARDHGRSLQAEALALLEAGARRSGDDYVVKLRRLRSQEKLNFDVAAALEALRGDRNR